MCGIFGYTGQPTAAAEMVFAGLKKLEYRGYDSWGITVAADGLLHTVRDVGKLGAPPTGLPAAGLALGHTRWAPGPSPRPTPTPTPTRPGVSPWSITGSSKITCPCARCCCTAATSFIRKPTAR